MNKFKESAKYFGENVEFQNTGIEHTGVNPIDSGKHRRSAFAALGEMEHLLNDDGITADDVWSFFKDTYNVSSRKHLTAEQWSIVATRLQGAKRELLLLQKLVDEIKTTFPDCKVHRIEPEITVKIYEGAFTGNIRNRCQTHADISGFSVQLTLPTGEQEMFVPNDVPF